MLARTAYLVNRKTARLQECSRAAFICNGRCIPESESLYAADRLVVGVTPTLLEPFGPVVKFLRKEVIQPQVPLRLPCYDLVPIREFILGACLPKVSPAI